MGVVIENQSQEDKSVWFLGTKKNNYKEMDGVLISNMFSDTFLDDNSLTMLKNWLISKGQIIIAVTRITADGSIHDAMGDNLIFREGGVGGQMGAIRLSGYFSPHQFNHNVLDISQQILVDALMSFNVIVNAGHKVGIMFFPSNNVSNAKTFDGEEFNNMFTKIKDTNKEYDETNKKRYLLLLR
jgi:hypothetical protein